MLARSRRIEVAGVEIETPLLVPAVSSKALGPIELGLGDRKSKLVPASMVHTETLITSIAEAVLVSAYDIHHGFVDNSGAFRKGFKGSVYAGPGLLIIDSGWYEKSVGPTAGQWYHKVSEQSLEFDLADYVSLVDSLDPGIRALLVSWDSHGPYLDQIKAAQDFFGARSGHASDVLLKPTGSRRQHDFTELSEADAARLRKFAVVGVTEKELGNSLLDRLVCLAHLRQRLDDAGVEAPIHVFGGLDPLTTPLYFAAGAEIFDGLAWLRYAFRGGMSVSRDNALLLDRSYSKRFPVAVGHVQLSNLDALAELAQELKVFHHHKGDWTKLRRGEDLQPAFEAMEAALRSSHGR